VQVILVLSKPVKTVLLSYSPCLTHILIEVTSEKDVVGLYIWVANEKVVAMEFSHGDMYVLVAMWCTVLNSLIEDVRVPSKLASGIKEDIMQGRVEGMDVRDALQWRAMEAVQDDVLRPPDLVPITWENDSNLPDRGIRGLIVMPMSP
jgi:hypothetical protein